MPKEYRYADAVRLLGGNDPRIQTLDTLLSAATLGAWDLIDAKGEFIKVGNDLLARWREWRDGDDWLSRTERLQAAHTIVVVTSFFEAFNKLNLPLRLANLGISRTEQDAIIDPLGSPALPSPSCPYEKVLRNLQEYYGRLGKKFRQFISGLTAWDQLATYQREAVIRGLEIALPKAALMLYQERYRKLAHDVPEFGLWANMVEHQATRAGLASLEQLLERIATKRVLPSQLEVLKKIQRAALSRPIAETNSTPRGMCVPSLQDAYIAPKFRYGMLLEGEDPSKEDWWNGKELYEDLSKFLAGYLTNADAGRTPLLILGQPGAGKSVLTKMLAARLPVDFFPIRVPLRSVVASASIQEQIEQAIFQATGERLQWTDIIRSVAGTLPVVLLDGLDELLQNNDIQYNDYLDKVATFQARESDAGRPAAVIVTSRLALAGRTGIPEGTAIIRIEPFDDKQINQWLNDWNAANAAYFIAQRLEPLSLEVTLTQRSLAEQPLLLLMLAIYDGDGNPLRKSMAEISQADLYEQLLRRFIEREVEKNHPRRLVPTLVEREIDRLSITAFAMFNRRRQWATAEEVGSDIATFGFSNTRPGELDAPSPAEGELTFGRFFFIHRAQATERNVTLEAYEFLHATFAEYLIARFVVSLLKTLAEREAAEYLDPSREGMLQAFLGWAAFSSRASIISFFQQIAKAQAVEIREAWHSTLLFLFRTLDARFSDAFPSYRPEIAGIHRRYAYYSANLLVLTIACTEKVRVSMLLSADVDAVAEWQRLALLWRSQCSASDWRSLVSLISTTPTLLDSEKRDISLELSSNAAWSPQRLDLRWFGREEIADMSTIRRQVAFSCLPDEALLLHFVEPLCENSEELLVPVESPDGVRSTLNVMMEIISLPIRQVSRLGYYSQIATLLPRDARLYPALKIMLGDLALFTEKEASQIILAVSMESPKAAWFMQEAARLHGLNPRLLQENEDRID